MGNCVSRDKSTEISGSDGNKANGHVGRGMNQQNTKIRNLFVPFGQNLQSLISN